MFRKFVALSALLTPVAASSQELTKWIESPVIFLPEDVPGDQRSLSEGDVFVDVPLRWALAGKLAGDVTVVAAGEAVTIKRDEVLPQVLIPLAGAADGGRILLCTRNKVIEKRSGIGIVAKLMDDLRDSLRDAQRCVEDTDQDGMMDQGVVLGESNDVIVAEPIEPVSYSLLMNEVIPGGEDKLTLSLWTVGNTRSRLWLSIVQRGIKRQFDTITSGRFFTAQTPTFEHKNGLPVSVNSLGLKVSLLQADRAEDSATLRWEATTRTGEYVIIPSTTQVSVRY